MTLINCKKNNKYKIKKMPNNHLLKVLGFRQGLDFLIQTKQPIKGPVVVKVKNRSIAIDYDVAMEIEVEEI